MEYFLGYTIISKDALPQRKNRTIFAFCPTTLRLEKRTTRSRREDKLSRNSDDVR